MTRKLFLIIISCLIVLVGCASEPTIRQELYDDSLKYYNLMSEKIMAIETYTEEDKKNLKAYNDKYDRMLLELNDEERLLFANVAGMSMKLDLLSEIYLMSTDEDNKKQAEYFVRAQIEAAKLMGLE